MFVVGSEAWLNEQLVYLRKKLGSKLPIQALEDPVGKPLLLHDLDFKTSHNTLHHLYHCYYYLDRTRTKPGEFKTVVEWGGGYGNMAKLWKRNINPQTTYVIVDTSLFCAIQWLYLRSTLGSQAVNLITESNQEFARGKLNILPTPLMDHVDLPKADLFISTWGLSESTKEAQDYVVEKNWFGADHLLIGFQDSTKELKHASRLGNIAEKCGSEIVNIKFIPNNHYAFK
jgi:hypothetical protein